ncbi:MAG: methyltransferase domain-containing protein [bacterium]
MKRIDANDKSVYGDSYINSYKKKRNEGRIDRIFKYVNVNSTDNVLDVGCGSGYLYPFIDNLGANYIGIDESKLFVEEAKSNFETSSKKNLFSNVSLSTLAKNNMKNFSKVFLLDVTEHLTDEEIVNVLNDSYDLMSPGGQLIIHTPNLNFILEQLKQHKVLKQTEGHIGVRNSKMYIELFRNSKFGNNYRGYFLSHYLKSLKPLKILTYVPLFGKLFEARLLFILNKA